MAGRKEFLGALGPGLVTGASDDDPSGIGTYSQVGARYGYAFLWSMPWCLLLMVSVQQICARMGRVRGHGLAHAFRVRFPPWLVWTVVGLLAVANTINIAADLAAMGDATSLLVGGPVIAYAAAFAVVSMTLEILVPYRRYANVLKVTCLALLAYVATAFAVRVDWPAALRATLLPRIEPSQDFVASLVAVFGTTISPYLFFWQASQEVEEEIRKDEAPLGRLPQRAGEDFSRIRWDTYVGMFASNLVGFFIIVTLAATVFAAGPTDLATSADAARALEPIAGRGAAFVFALGIVGTGLLALPVFAGATAFAVGEAARWPVGLERKPHQAKAFYGVIAAGTLLGLGLVLVRVPPIRALFLSGVVNGLVAPIILVMLLVAARSSSVMGTFTVPRRLLVVGWVTAAVMGAMALALVATLF